MKHKLLIGASCLVFAAMLVGGLRLAGNADAQSSAPPRIFQTEVRQWAGDGVNSESWPFTYLDDGSLHVLTRGDDGSCATIAVPGGVFVSFIDQDGITGSQPGNDQPLTICEAFFTRANG